MSPTESEASPVADPFAPVKVVFFGLGAVGSNILICLAELAERDGVPIRFVVYTIDPQGARDALFHAERYFDRITFVGLPDFAPIFAFTPPYDAQLAGATLLVNAALPDFNSPIIEIGVRVGAYTVDLASDMYNERTDQSLAFDQYRHDAALRERGVGALINQGISPGVTDFLIGRSIHGHLGAGGSGQRIESVDLYLLEDIDSDSVVFSWSPVVALEELAARPRILSDGLIRVMDPFSLARYHVFPNEPRPTRQYPLYQEELLSLHRAFPQIPSIGIYTGGSEVELVKALFQLNLLSKQTLPDQPELTVEAMVRAILPGMQRPRRIEDLLRSGVIRRAHFCASAEIRISETIRNERQTVIETVGLSYLRYKDLLGSPYAGATYISYPTGVGAAILAWHSVQYARAAPGKMVGVLSGEDLARLLPQARADAVRRDLVAWDIDLFQSVRDASIL
ncbi:MAG: saccharopine dehydrogenase [Chromatiaceae bacterium]